MPEQFVPAAAPVQVVVPLLAQQVVAPERMQRRALALAAAMNAQLPSVPVL
jgi:hypothetical protein